MESQSTSSSRVFVGARPQTAGVCRNAFLAKLGSNRPFTRLKGYPPVLYTCGQWLIRARALPLGVHHENSHSSLDLLYGRCRFYVGNNHAINHQHQHARLNYWSSHWRSARDNVHSQSQTQTYLGAALAPLRTERLGLLFTVVVERSLRFGCRCNTRMAPARPRMRLAARTGCTKNGL